MPTERRDVFIIHTQGDEYEARLVEELKDVLDPFGVYAYGYEDWEWEAEIEKRVWRSSGTRLDPLRYAARHPQPFEHRVRERAPDRDALSDIFDRTRLVVLVAPRAVQAARASALLRRAASKVHTGDAEGAPKDYGAVAAMKKRVPPVLRASALLNRAGLHIQEGRPREAVADLDAVVLMREAAPEQHLTALYERARAKTETGDREGARADYARLLESKLVGPATRAEVESLLAAPGDAED